MQTLNLSKIVLFKEMYLIISPLDLKKTETLDAVPLTLKCLTTISYRTAAL